MVSQGKWFRRGSGFAGEMVSQGKWYRRGNGLAGEVVSQGKWFLVTLANIFVIIIVEKQITYNEKASDTTIKIFLRN